MADGYLLPEKSKTYQILTLIFFIIVSRDNFLTVRDYD